MKIKKTIKKLCLIAFASFMIMPQYVLAEGDEVTGTTGDQTAEVEDTSGSTGETETDNSEESEETEDTEKNTGELCSLTIKYYDDSDQTVPVTDSDWVILRIADVYTIQEYHDVDALQIESLIGIDLTLETELDDILEQLNVTKVTESDYKVSSIAVNEVELPTYEVTVVDGTATLEDLPYGVYIGFEVDAAVDHQVAAPFVITLPTTDEDGLISSIDVTVEPKAVLAGDIKIEKKLEGNNTEKSKDWTMKLTLPEGIFYYKASDGEEGYVSNGDTVSIKGGETVTIEDVTGGESYSVTESEENKNSYKTSYENQSGTVPLKSIVEVKVTNKRSRVDVPIADTAENGTNTTMLLAIGGVGLIMIASGLIIAKRKKDEQEQKGE